ncbi:MAG: CarD family transcriptional regulator [Clostridia bacterium]|nr:CarD family transcriptional regulator [Clostridia bacterium]
MYNIGEKIVYPMHGAGVIEAIEEKEILGKLQKYYILKIATTNMDIMVPVATADEIGVRPIIDPKDLGNILEQIKHYNETDDLNWNKRYRLNLQKIKTGNIVEVGQVIKSLLLRESIKALSTCEKKMLNNARQIMASEIVLATNRELEDVELQINSLAY